MTPEERIERTEANLDKLTGVVSALASSVVSHDNQIEALIQVVEKHEAETVALKAQLADLARQWQAYINTLPRQ
jgi:hypothetical protein